MNTKCTTTQADRNPGLEQAKRMRQDYCYYITIGDKHKAASEVITTLPT